MTKRFSMQLTEKDSALIQLFNQETPVQCALREETIQQVPHHHMMTTPEQIAFLQLLIKMQKVRRMIEVGVFTGYGTLGMADALPDDGLLVACDHSETWPLIGKPYWEEAGVSDKIDLHIAPAIETLQALIDEGEEASFDFIFIDADKINYDQYYHLSDQLLRDGGVIIFDNALRIHEKIVANEENPATRAVASLLRKISTISRYRCSLIPMAEGMLLAHKLGYNNSL